jgi:hypothetical protein
MKKHPWVHPDDDNITKAIQLLDKHPTLALANAVNQLRQSYEHIRRDIIEWRRHEGASSKTAWNAGYRNGYWDGKEDKPTRVKKKIIEGDTNGK